MIEIEERLAQHLSQRALGATVRSDLEGVTAAPTVVTLRRVVAPPRFRTRRTVIALVTAAMVFVAATVLVAGRRSTTPASPYQSHGGTSDQDCIVFLRPEASQEDIIATGNELRSRPEVTDLRLVTQQEAFEEFRRLFAEKPDIVDYATADILPASWRFDLDPDSDKVRAMLANDFERGTNLRNVSNVSCADR